MMRIITGTARGYRLKTLPGEEITRPTAERVKESIFSALQFEIEGRAVLDLFAGSGQMGLEALSRGAKSCVCVDLDKNACAVIKDNAVGAKLADRLMLRQVPAETFLSGTTETFDVAFLDPPYKAGLLPAILPKLCDRMREGGVAVCETDNVTTLPEHVSGSSLSLTLEKQRTYGKTTVWFYRCVSI